MLILIGTVPTAYALNRAGGREQEHLPAFIEASDQAIATLDAMAAGAPAVTDPQLVLQQFVGAREFTPEVLPALAARRARHRRGRPHLWLAREGADRPGQ